VHVTWLRGDRPVVLDGQRIYLAADGSLVVNATGNPEVARSSLGAVYTCHVTNGITSDTRQVRLGYDVISGVSDWSTLPWTAATSLTGSSVFVRGYDTVKIDK